MAICLNSILRLRLHPTYFIFSQVLTAISKVSTSFKNDIAEDQLVALLKSHHPESFGYLYDHYASSLFGVILRIVASNDIAEEVLQDVMLTIWQKISQYDASRGKLFTWMLNIARNQAIDKIRSRKYKEDRKTDTVADNVHTIDRERYTEQDSDDIGIRDLLSSLNENQRLVVDLIYFRGYTQSEVAREFNIPLGTVKTRMRSALVQLRKMVH